MRRERGEKGQSERARERIGKREEEEEEGTKRKKENADENKNSLETKYNLDSTQKTSSGGAAVGFPGSNSRTVQLAAKAAIMDSGTTAILMSDADSARLHAAVPGLSYNAQGGYYAVTGGCDAVSSLPDITFVLGGRPYAVPARLWLGGGGLFATNPPDQRGTNSTNPSRKALKSPNCCQAEMPSRTGSLPFLA